MIMIIMILMILMINLMVFAMDKLIVTVVVNCIVFVLITTV